MTKYYSGKYKVINREKYKGDPDNVIYRSSWEIKVFSWLDNNKDVISWGSEEFCISYLSPVDNKIHRYFPDIIVKVRTQNNDIKVMVLEIKPKKQTQPPKQPKRITKQFINEVATYGVNQAKWKAANEYCLDRGWEFRVITEDDLGL